MSDTPAYTPPKVWTWDKPNGGRFANTNRPIAGPTHEKELPVGRHPLQLYSLATPNGVKVTIMLEELLALGHKGAEYDAWLIKIGDGDQFGSGFVAINPNSKIPALIDRAEPSRSACSSPVRFSSISPRNSAPCCRPSPPRAPNACPGCSGRWERALSRRRLRPFLRLCADQDRICHQPLRHGDEAPARRARPPPGRKRIYRRRQTTPSPTSRSGRGTAAWRKGAVWRGEFLRCRTTRTCSAG